MYIKRDIGPRLSEYLQQFRIVSLTGPRQSGKSTFLQNEHPEYPYFNFDNPATLAEVSLDPEGFLDHNPKCIIDEAQKFPPIFSYLKMRVDTDNEIGQFILSGSQSFLMNHHITDSLAGRVGLCKMYPLTYQERLRFSGKNDDLYQNIFQGGYPATYASKLDLNTFFSSYIETTVERDLKDLSAVQNLDDFRAFILLAASYVGKIVDYSKMSKVLGISVPTVRAWMNLCETMLIFFRLHSYHVNIGKRVVKRPKLYFYDTGLLCNLLGFSSADQIYDSEYRGFLFENFILCELKKRDEYLKQYNQFYFMRDNNQQEVDIVRGHGLTIDLIETKSLRTSSLDFVSGIRSFEKVSKGVDKKFVVYDGDQTFTFYGVDVIPWRQFLDL